MIKQSVTLFIQTQSDIDDVFESVYTTIISNIQKSLGKGSDWIIDSVIDHNISIPNYNPVAENIYIKLPKELDHPRKALISTQIIVENECFKWSIVRYLNPANHNPRRIAKADEKFTKKLDFKGIKFLVKVRDIHKIKKKKKNSIGISTIGYENEKHLIYVSKEFEKKHVHLLLMAEEGKRHCFY